jgi:hypothetical protein
MSEVWFSICAHSTHNLKLNVVQYEVPSLVSTYPVGSGEVIILTICGHN